MLNENYNDGMFSSVQVGVRALNPSEAFFILPVGIPFVQENTVHTLIAALKKDPSSLLF